MKILKKTLPIVLSFAFAAMAAPALSDAKPKGAKRLSAAAVQNLFAGHTHPWSKGGIYYAANGSYQQIWEKSIGIGTWKVSKKGDLCKNVYYIRGGQANPDTKSKGDNCVWLLQTSDGAIWINDQDRKSKADRKNEWWTIVKAGGESHKLKKGNKIAKGYNKIAKKEGLHPKAAAAESTMKPIKTEAEFVSMMTGKKLWVTKKNNILYNADGTYGGDWNGKPFTATWKWKGAYMCRVLNGKTKEVCQSFKGNGTYFKGTSNKGKGSFWFMSTKK